MTKTTKICLTVLASLLMLVGAGPNFQPQPLDAQSFGFPANPLYFVTNAETTTGRDTANTLPAIGGFFYVFSYRTQGAPSGVSVRMDADIDGTGASWQTCANTETSTASGRNACTGAYSRMAINVISLSGGTAPVVNWAMAAYAAPPPGFDLQQSTALFGMSNVSVLASASALSNKIDLRGARSVTFEVTCTQNFNVGIETFDDSGATVFQDYVLFTGGLANDNAVITIKENVAPTAIQNTGTTPVTNGAALTAGTGTFALPARTVKLYVTNTSVSTGTCNGRPLVQF